MDDINMENHCMDKTVSFGFIYDQCAFFDYAKYFINTNI